MWAQRGHDGEGYQERHHEGAISGKPGRVSMRLPNGKGFPGDQHVPGYQRTGLLLQDCMQVSFLCNVDRSCQWFLGPELAGSWGPWWEGCPLKGEGLHVELQAEAVQSGTSVVCHWPFPSLPSSSQMASPQHAVWCLLDSPSGYGAWEWRNIPL